MAGQISTTVKKIENRNAEEDSLTLEHLKARFFLRAFPFHLADGKGFG
jgi:hypothetical protein